MNSVYTYCRCPDCFEIVVSNDINDPDFCDECIEAGRDDESLADSDVQSHHITIPFNQRGIWQALDNGRGGGRGSAVIHKWALSEQDYDRELDLWLIVETYQGQEIQGLCPCDPLMEG